MLTNLLTGFNDDVHSVSFSIFDNDRNEFLASHAFNEMKYKGQYYLLDPTSNRVSVPMSKSFRSSKKLPDFYRLKQQWDAEIIFNLGKVHEVIYFDRLPGDEV